MDHSTSNHRTLFGALIGMGTTLALVICLGVLAGAGGAAGPQDVPTNDILPTITGVARVGQTLTGSMGTWLGNPSSFSYQWIRCDENGDHCSFLSGATSTTRTITSADLGQTIRFRVEAINQDGHTFSTSLTTAKVAAAAASGSPPSNTSSPTVSGTPQEGKTLTGHPGGWTGNPSDYNYYWLHCDTNGNHCSYIGGANNATYTPASSDVGTTLRFRVDAKNASGTTSAYSVPTAVVAAAPTGLPRNTSLPTIAGTPQEGKPLSGDRGKWTGNPGDYNYYWLHCDTNGNHCSYIGGANNATYTPASSDVGTTLRFRVDAKNASGTTSAYSVPTAVVVAGPNLPRNTASPTISGTPAVGRVLTLRVGTWTGAQPISFRYQWYRCNRSGGGCTAIHGAFGLTWRILQASVGHTIRAAVTATNPGGTSSATSVPTAVISAAATKPPPTPPTAAGCPSGTGAVNIANIGSPARLLIDAQQTNPSVVTRGTNQLIVRYHVSACGGRSVQGALVYATAVPFNQLTIPSERQTNSSGWAELDFHMLAGFPVSSKQQLIAIFARARKPGENILGGISTRRLFSIKVNLNG